MEVLNNVEDVMVSFETALLTKEKGYLQESTKLSQPYYNHKGELNGSSLDYIKARFAFRDGKISQEEVDKVDSIRAMSQSLLQKWIRENFKLHIQITTEAFKNGYNWNIQVIDLDFDNSNTEFWKEFGARTTGLYGDNGEYKTYEEALEFGLQLALKLI